MLYKLVIWLTATARGALGLSHVPLCWLLFKDRSGCVLPWWGMQERKYMKERGTRWQKVPTLLQEWLNLQMVLQMQHKAKLPSWISVCTKLEVSCGFNSLPRHLGTNTRRLFCTGLEGGQCWVATPMLTAVYHPAQCVHTCFLYNDALWASFAEVFSAFTSSGFSAWYLQKNK